MTDENTRIEEMVERVPWLRPVDYSILTFLSEHDIWVTPLVVALNIDYDRSYTGKAMRRLVRADLLVGDDGAYELSETGREFLAGEIAPADLEDPDEES